MLDMLEFLRDEGVSADITAEIEKFRDAYPEEDETLRRRVPDPRYLYYGKDIWEEAITAILCGENLLLVGPKATGKNVLAENLATVFGRPSWNVSFYINTDAATLLGTDTFENGAVQLRKGPIYQCAGDRAASACWMRSTWPRTSLWRCSTPRWTSAAPSTCLAMNAFPFTTPPASSPP